MQPKVLKSEADYEAALAAIDGLLVAPAGSAAADQLELWSHLVEDYEARQQPIPPPDAVTAIRFRMEQQGLRQADLVPYLGSSSAVSEVLRGKRPLSLAMIRRLHRGLGIPAEILIGEPVAETCPP